jgi:putative methionine-R-sulfoxide reductase with GAF domain
VTGGVVNEQVRVDVFTADLFGVFAVGCDLAVLGGQSANAVGDVHQHVGAIDRETALARAGDILFGHDVLEGAVMSGFPLFTVRGFDDLLLSLDDNSLEILGAANCAGAAAARGAVIFVHPARKFDEVLACGADGDDGEVFLAVFFLEMFNGVVDVLSPNFGGVHQFDLVIMDVGIGRFCGFAFENESVKARPA